MISPFMVLDLNQLKCISVQPCKYQWKFAQLKCAYKFVFFPVDAQSWASIATSHLLAVNTFPLTPETVLTLLEEEMVWCERHCWERIGKVR